MYTKHSKILKHKLPHLILLSSLMTGCTSLQELGGLFISKPPQPQGLTPASPMPDTTRISITPLQQADANGSQDWYQPDAHTIVMRPGAQITLRGSVILRDSTRSGNLHWSSSDSSVIHVQQGHVTANQIGEATLVATSVLDTQIKSYLTVIVKEWQPQQTEDAVRVNRIQIQPPPTEDGQWRWQANQLFAQPSQEIPLQAVVEMSNGGRSSNVSWRSTNSEVASISADGRVQTHGPGETRIIATSRLDERQETQIILNVSGQIYEKQPSVQPIATPSPWPTTVPTFYPVPPTALSVSVTRVRMAPVLQTIYKPGDTLSLYAQVINSDGTTSNSIQWYSTDERVATIDANGFVQFHQPGQTIIIATALQDSSMQSAVVLQVDPPA